MLIRRTSHLVKRTVAAAAAIALVGIGVTATAASAVTTITVTSDMGSGPGTLADAVNQANGGTGGDTIVFDSSVTDLDSQAVLELKVPVTINGTGVTVDGALEFHVAEGNNGDEESGIPGDNGAGRYSIVGFAVNSMSLLSRMGSDIDGTISVNLSNLSIGTADSPGQLSTMLSGGNVNRASTIALESSTLVVEALIFDGPDSAAVTVRDTTLAVGAGVNLNLYATVASMVLDGVTTTLLATEENPDRGNIDSFILSSGGTRITNSSLGSVRELDVVSKGLTVVDSSEISNLGNEGRFAWTSNGAESLAITDSTFTGISTELRVHDGGGDAVTVSGSTFTANTTPQGEGVALRGLDRAFYLNSDGASTLPAVTFSDSEISEFSGIGIDMSGGVRSFTMTNSTIRGAKYRAPGTLPEDELFWCAQKGLLVFAEGEVLIDRSEVYDACNGGAEIHNWSGTEGVPSEPVTITKSSFYNIKPMNSSGYQYATALLFEVSDSLVTVDQSTIDDASVGVEFYGYFDWYGELVYPEPPGLTVTNSTISNVGMNDFDNATAISASGSGQLTIANSTVVEADIISDYAPVISAGMAASIDHTTITGGRPIVYQSIMLTRDGMATTDESEYRLKNSITSSILSSSAVGEPSVRGTLMNPEEPLTISRSILGSDKASVESAIDGGGFVVWGEGNQFSVPATQLNLGQLNDNGGPTKTLFPGVGSVALENGAPVDSRLLTTSTATDQRGLARPYGLADVGAVEVQAGHVTVGPDVTVNGGQTAIVEVTRAGGVDSANSSVTVTVNLVAGTAEAGTDYTEMTPVTLTFGPGETTKMIDVATIETTGRGSRTVSVAAQDSTVPGVVISPDAAVVTIIQPDDGGVVTPPVEPTPTGPPSTSPTPTSPPSIGPGAATGGSVAVTGAAGLAGLATLIAAAVVGGSLLIRRARNGAS